jgi:hypothetical protein
MWDLRNRGHLNCRNDPFVASLLEPSVSRRGGGIGGLGAAADSCQGPEDAAKWRDVQESNWFQECSCGDIEKQ